MKVISVCILLICILSATFSKWVVIGAYQINQQYIASHFCENKATPSAHCNGHCYLNRQLQKQEKPESPLNSKSNEKFEVQLFCSHIPENAFGFFIPTSLKFYYKQNFTPQEFIQLSYHPPKI